METQSLAVLVLVLIFGAYFAKRAYDYIDNWVISHTGEDYPFIADINLFIGYWVSYCGLIYWVYKLIFIALGKNYTIFSAFDLYLLSVVLITGIGFYLSLTFSRVFGLLSLVLIFWPIF